MGADLPLQAMHGTHAQPNQLGRLDDISALGQLQARGLKLFLLDTRATELRAANASLPANELAVPARVSLTVCIPARTRVLIMVRSNSANAPVIWNSSLPMGVVVPMFCGSM